MKLLKTLALSAALALTSAAASAETFNFSYTFSDASVLSGSLTGVLNGLFIDDVSNIHVSLNGNEFTGAPLYAAAWDAVAQTWSASAPVVSTNASLNNFIFADANVPTDFGVSNYFYFTNDSTNGTQVFANNLNTGDIALDGPTATASWSIAAAPVPEPESYALMLAGLGILGTMVRRRFLTYFFQKDHHATFLGRDTPGVLARLPSFHSSGQRPVDGLRPQPCRYRTGVRQGRGGRQLFHSPGQQRHPRTVHCIEHRGLGVPGRQGVL
jgi:hypothetical protein